MTQKKSFILRVPNFLATEAGGLKVKLLLASCYITMLIGYFFPLIGSLAATVYCLVVWQVFNIKFNKDNRYEVYSRFLIQRVLFCMIFVFVLFLFSVDENGVDQQSWFIVYVVLGFLNLSDLLLALKGFVGIGYIDGSKHNK